MSSKNPFCLPAKSSTPAIAATPSFAPSATSAASKQSNAMVNGSAVLPTTSNLTGRGNKRRKSENSTPQKSTVTQTSPSALTQHNAFNSILDEAENLRQAAAEAQQLGRLQMASTYLLLLHARLVGLGKRFDKAYVNPNEAAVASRSAAVASRPTAVVPQQLHFDPPAEIDAPVDKIIKRDDDDDDDLPSFLGKDGKDLLLSPVQQAVREKESSPPASMRSKLALPSSHKKEIVGKTEEVETNEPAVVATPTSAARQLARALPSNIELDSAMMEHLAKAAAELQAARSKKKRHRPPNNTADQSWTSVQPTLPSEPVDWELPSMGWMEPRKPATSAMNTAPNANTNLKTLLQGEMLKSDAAKLEEE